MGGASVSDVARRHDLSLEAGHIL
ncbi:hypothetical protein [Acetobacter fallax]